MNKKDLHVIAVISNPAGYKSRYNLYKQFEKHMKDSGANLYTVELAFNDDSFKITEFSNTKHIQLRTNDELWHKENLINIAISKLPSNYKYVAWIDADIEFTRKDWIEATLSKLQDHQIIQLWQDAVNLGPNNEFLAKDTSLAYCNQMSKVIGKEYGGHWHSGYAWAATREFIDQVGGLIDTTLVGAADHQMAMALVGKAEDGVHGSSHKNLKQEVFDWAKKAEKVLENGLGFLEGTILHYWHGSKKNRKYVERWSIVTDNDFDPKQDLTRDDNGLLHLVGNKPKLQADLKEYFRSRDEDSKEV